MMDIYTFQKSRRGSNDVRICMYELRKNIIFQKKKERRSSGVYHSVSVFKTLIQRGETQKHTLFLNILKNIRERIFSLIYFFTYFVSFIYIEKSCMETNYTENAFVSLVYFIFFFKFFYFFIKMGVLKCTFFLSCW